MRLSEHASFTKLVAEQHFLLEAFVASLTRGRGGGELVDDLVQETISVAWGRFGSYDRSRPFGPWLRGIAALIIQARFRQEATRSRIRSGPEFESDFMDRLEVRFAAMEPSGAAERRELTAALRGCIDSLKSEFAEIVSLHYWRGMDASQAAASLGIALETARKRLQRAREQIATCLGSKGFPMSEPGPHGPGEASA